MPITARSYRARPNDADEVLEHEDDAEEGEDDCLICCLTDNVDREPLRARLARMAAYGVVFMAAGDGVALCDDCDEALSAELADADTDRKDLQAEPRRRKAARDR